MTDPSPPDVEPTPCPPYQPWYHSAILRGIVAGIVSQLLIKAHAHYGWDLTVFGLDVNNLTDLAMDGISAAATAYAVHGRVARPLPPLTLTKRSADAKNSLPITPGVT